LANARVICKNSIHLFVGDDVTLLGRCVEYKACLYPGEGVLGLRADGGVPPDFRTLDPYRDLKGENRRFWEFYDPKRDKFDQF